MEEIKTEEMRDVELELMAKEESQEEIKTESKVTAGCLSRRNTDWHK